MFLQFREYVHAVCRSYSDRSLRAVAQLYYERNSFYGPGYFRLYLWDEAAGSSQFDFEGLYLRRTTLDRFKDKAVTESVI